MILTPAQRIVASDTHRFRVVNAGRRWGKTILSVEEMLGVAIGKKDARIAYIAPTYQSARDIAWEALKKRALPITADTNEQRLELKIKNQHGGIGTVILRGWEAIETLRGQYFDFLVPDEVAMYRNFWTGWQEVLRPTLADKKGGALFISTPKGFNHFYDLYNLERTEEAFKSFHYTSYDNPHIDPKEIDEARRQMTEDRFAQEFLGDFRKQEGLVYKEFARDTHVYDDLTPRRQTIRILCGIDWGFTNPAAILRVEKDSDDHYWVSWEWYKRERQTSEIVEVAASVGANTYYPDPAEPDRILELERAGLNVHDVSKDITAGIATVRDLFAQNRLHIHKDCVNLISELETYAYEDPQPDKNQPEKPRKEKDHAVDALRYVLHMDAHTGAFINSSPLAIY